jgi:hypothetical protein
MPLAPDVNLADLARQTPSFSGSDRAALGQREALDEIRALVRAELSGAPPATRVQVGLHRFTAAIAEQTRLKESQRSSA